MTLLAYDIEVFKDQSCVVFKTMDGKTDRIFTNNLAGLGEYIDKGILTHSGYQGLEEYLDDKVLVGYNNHHYDDYVLYAMCKNLDQSIIKEWNDNIINNGSRVNMKKVSNRTYDAFQQISVARPSLKKVEGNLGKSIIESDVNFDYEGVLNPKDNLSVVKYCEYDVLQAIEIYNMRSDYFESKKAIVDMIDDKNLREKAINWNTTSIVGQILKPKRKAPSRLLVDETMLNYVPTDVKNMWLELNNTLDYKFNTKKVIVEDFGCKVEFGWGGLHGAPDRVYEARDVKLLDVASMYPNILILLNGLGDKTDDYKGILEYRLKLKHKGKKKEQAPYKLILNSTYGLLNNQYSMLNNPKLAYSICIYGQISLYVLSSMLSGIGCKVFNINTDGVAFTSPDDEYKKVWNIWQETFGLTLELDEFDYWIQKDVNNYIAVDKNKNIKVKGGDVNKYSRPNYFNNNDIRIVDLALVDYIVKDVPIDETIIDNLDNPLLFQYILQAGNTYKGTVDQDDNEYQKVNRAFAIKDNGVTLFKKRQDNGLVKFADTPKNMWIYNGDIEDIDTNKFKQKIDLQWYYDLTRKRLERWRV